MYLIKHVVKCIKANLLPLNVFELINCDIIRPELFVRLRSNLRSRLLTIWVTTSKELEAIVSLNEKLCTHCTVLVDSRNRLENVFISFVHNQTKINSV